jgi:hypothetical protein
VRSIDSHKWQKVRHPERVLLLQTSRTQAREGAYIGSPIVPHENTGTRETNINHLTLARLGIDLDVRLERRTLLTAHGCNASFQATCSETDRNHSGNETTHGRASLDGHGSRGYYQNDHTDEVDWRRPDDGLELAKILIYSRPDSACIPLLKARMSLDVEWKAHLQPPRQ